MGSHPTTTPRRDRRQVVYEFLKERGERWTSHRELAELGVSSALIHVESLRFEGHGIEQTAGRDHRGFPATYLRLVRDAWGEGGDQ